MKTTIKNTILNNCKALAASTIIFICLQVKAQIPPNAVNADPAVMSIAQVPSGSNIGGSALLRFRFRDAAPTSNSTGQIPAGGIRLTISFPGQYAFTSANSIPKFDIEDFDDQPYGIVHLVNNSMILENETIDLLLNVRGTQTGTGTVTFNADRTTPIITANTLTANDNVSASFTTSSTLPVKLKDFSVMANGCTAKLSWTTASEVNFVKFDVMRSTDGGQHYTTVRTVAASGSQSAEKTYVYEDQMKGSMSHLYRLKMIDKDGSFAYSPIARINSGCATAEDQFVKVFPSPAISTITLDISNKELIKTSASIIDMSGRIVKTITITGTSMLVLVNDLQPGMYMIKLQDNTNVKFVKE